MSWNVRSLSIMPPQQTAVYLQMASGICCALICQGSCCLYTFPCAGRRNSRDPIQHMMSGNITAAATYTPYLQPCDV
eukprot:scaffold326654_cov15-Prasinocladus_malaysianus.AAC.1